MGGILIIISIVIPTLLWADLRYPYVWIAIAALLGYGWIGFLDDYAKVTKQRNLGLSGKRKLVYQFSMGFAFAGALLVMRAYGDFSTTMNIPFIKQFKPSLLIDLADGEPLDVRDRGRALLHLRRAGGGLLFQRRQPDRRPGRAGHRPDGDRRRRADGARLCGRPRAACAISATGAQSAHQRADHFLRLDDRRQSRLPLVQRASGGDLHGRRGLARAWAARWRWWRC